MLQVASFKSRAKNQLVTARRYRAQGVWEGEKLTRKTLPFPRRYISSRSNMRGWGDANGGVFIACSTLPRVPLDWLRRR